jgi:hypothetical protein
MTSIPLEEWFGEKSRSLPFSCLGYPFDRLDTLNAINRILPILWKHNGAIVGGFLQNFYFPYQTGLVSKTCLENFLPGVLIPFVLNFLKPTFDLDFRDIDVWFSSVTDAGSFIVELIEHKFLGMHRNSFTCFDSSLAKILMEYVPKDHEEKLTEQIHSYEYAKFRGFLKIPKKFIILDVMISPTWKANNYTCNLVSLTLTRTQEWKTEVWRPYSDKMQDHFDWFVDRNQEVTCVPQTSLLEVLWQSFSRETWRLPEIEELIVTKEKSADIPVFGKPNCLEKEISMKARGWIIHSCYKVS